MTTRNEELRIRLGRVRTQGDANGKRFLNQVLRAAEKAGGVSRGASGSPRSSSFGRGRAASVQASRGSVARTRLVTVKARVVRLLRRPDEELLSAAMPSNARLQLKRTSSPRRAAAHERRVQAVATLALAAAAVELLAGWLTGSAALLAEGLHMTAHVTAFALAGLAYVAARRLEGANRPRAAGAVPDLAALLNGLILLGLGIGLSTNSIEALSVPAPIAYSSALGVAVFGLAVNIVAASLLHHDHAHEPGHGRDMNFRAIYLHVIGDGAVAVLAIVGLLLGLLAGWLRIPVIVGGDSSPSWAPVPRDRGQRREFNRRGYGVRSRVRRQASDGPARVACCLRSVSAGGRCGRGGPGWRRPGSDRR